jgi:hypothetical protein
MIGKTNYLKAFGSREAKGKPKGLNRVSKRA